MPKFHEIYATAKQPFKIVYRPNSKHPATATVDEDKVTWDASGALVSAVSAATYEWELVTEPTFGSVLRDRGYEWFVDSYGDFRVHTSGDPNASLLFRCPDAKRPTTPEQATEIANLLDQYR